MQNRERFSALAPDGQSEGGIEKKEPEISEVNFDKGKPIIEDKDSVSYLGVRLEKAKTSDGVYVPDRAKIAEYYVNDEYALKLQQKMAIAMKLGQNLLVEGGTAIGKTTTVAKMCSELGYELHYLNLNGQTDVDNLMGRYIPNANKKKAEDPEYAFTDGSVTSGLRQEDGKIKVIVLDEVNATNPAVLKRLNEVLNAVEQGGTVVLSEDASEVIKVSKDTTRVVALMNPSGQGYLGVNPLSKELINRFVYQKEVDELPRESFGFRLLAKRGKGPRSAENLDAANFLSTQEHILSMDQFNDIPGIDDILIKFEEFHFAAKELLKNRNIAADQLQLFLYDDQRESDRIINFVRQFYSGDINDTMAKALEYYYINKLQNDDDKAKLMALSEHVIYIPPVGASKRRGLEADPDEREKEILLSEIDQLEKTVDGEKGVSRPEFRTEFKDLLSGETKALTEFFGKKIDIPALPAEITKAKYEQWQKQGFELHYLPDIDMTEDKDFPGWSKDKRPKDLYQYIKDGKADKSATNLPGKWILIDGRAKPRYDDGDQMYDNDILGPVIKELREKGIIDEYKLKDSRFNIRWNELNKDEVKKAMAKVLDTKPENIRLPRAIEWNVLGNLHHSDWGKTDTSEWFNDETKEGLIGYRLYGGNSGLGGLSRVDRDSSDNRRINLGFRPLVCFS